jgi:hypothetical protein
MLFLRPFSCKLHSVLLLIFEDCINLTNCYGEKNADKLKNNIFCVGRLVQPYFIIKVKGERYSQSIPLSFILFYYPVQTNSCTEKLLNFLLLIHSLVI